jgi:hypothetical protein
MSLIYTILHIRNLAGHICKKIELEVLTYFIGKQVVYRNLRTKIKARLDISFC